MFVTGCDQLMWEVLFHDSLSPKLLVVKPVVEIMPSVTLPGQHWSTCEVLAEGKL